MRHGPVLDAASAFIDLLVHSAELALRDRLILETGMAAAAAESGALWRRSPGSDWRPSVERGRRGGRFEAERATRRALESPVATTLPGFSLVRSEIGAQGVALVLAGDLDEDAQDALEALLTCLSIVELAGGSPPGPEAPLPAAARAGEVGRIQHDVRNALTSLMATRQVLERFGNDLSPAERHAFAEAVNRECERTGSILALGLTGRRTPQSAPASAAEIVADVLALERAEIERAGCQLRASISDEARSAAPACGSDAWSRIVRNLVSNAREAASAGRTASTIDVRLERSGEGLRLCVEDVAGGLPGVPLPRLFEDGFTAGKTGGTGQGLCVVRALCLEAGGDIVVERLRGGSRFEVWMPVSSALWGDAQAGPGPEKNSRQGFTPPPGHA